MNPKIMLESKVHTFPVWSTNLNSPNTGLASVNSDGVYVENPEVKAMKRHLSFCTIQTELENLPNLLPNLAT